MSDSASRFSSLLIRAYRVQVHLGVTEEERAVAQDVEFDAQIDFDAPPHGSDTDRIEDTLCYAELCEAIRLRATRQPYRLVEALGRETYGALRQAIARDSRNGPSVRAVQITVHKLRPPVDQLRGGVRFTYGDAR